ncbi:hemK methyltransferase family member 2-like isoform X2 [Pomacea canaliculata]|nr:hemK methyltransferase family member 2-like isoform X2 [Pomacea canaliculata]XP_025089103.1 hemK methyltransferase family member 2-like isoform X2 [Pomacea canaliculata]XP_025089104.1 hemK methyltransferase family member 2-like isoform X2 [Pomacea canaliculata]XP_025089106.1 hemK methyltransferase family member 2-like isoform X2 [Pomacea canaliculata]
MECQRPVFATPDTSHLSPQDFDLVYEPAEDSFLLLDALESEYFSLRKLRPTICVEVGCGSGICITFLASMFGPGACYICTDINPTAAKVAAQTADQNKVLIHPIVCDLTDAINDQLRGKVDILVFNPPYVVTPSNEVGNGGIEASWAGGEKGREVIDRFLPHAVQLLSLQGILYLVIIKENRSDEIEDKMRQFGLHMTTVKNRRAGKENLYVLKFTRVT